jgi:hypothetical protein
VPKNRKDWLILIVPKMLYPFLSKRNYFAYKSFINEMIDNGNKNGLKDQYII